MVNQLLAKMDGVEQLENVLIVGLTNRPELIDAALLRPGRLEVQVEVPRPDAAGRQQILRIQSAELRERGSLEPRAAACLASGALARVTEGFSGADLAGLMRSATSYSLERYVEEALQQGWEPGAAKPARLASGDDGAADPLEVRYEDLVRALREASPRKSFSRRPTRAGGVQGKGDGQGGGGKREARRRLRDWWRERRLRSLTDKAVGDETNGGAAAAALRLRGGWTGAAPLTLRHGAARSGAAVAQTADIACDEESCEPDDASPQTSLPQNPALTAPGEQFKQAVYTKTPGGGPAEPAAGDVTFTPRPDAARGYPPLDDELLAAVVAAAERAVSDPDASAQEAYGDWIRDEYREACLDALAGLRGRKLVRCAQPHTALARVPCLTCTCACRARQVWWLDSPRPLRAVAARGAKYEVSVVALPGGCSLPPAAFPRGSVIYLIPLLGQLTVRRLRFDITGKTSTPIELMKRVLKAGVKPYFLSGGCCHSFEGVPGVASAYLQLAMMPPTSNFPPGHSGGEGSVGWRRPPGESCEENLDVVAGVSIGVEKGKPPTLADPPFHVPPPVRFPLMPKPCVVSCQSATCCCWTGRARRRWRASASSTAPAASPARR